MMISRAICHLIGQQCTHGILNRVKKPQKGEPFQECYPMEGKSRKGRVKKRWPCCWWLLLTCSNVAVARAETKSFFNCCQARWCVLVSMNEKGESHRMGRHLCRIDLLLRGQFKASCFASRPNSDPHNTHTHTQTHTDTHGHTQTQTHRRTDTHSRAQTDARRHRPFPSQPEA